MTLWNRFSHTNDSRLFHDLDEAEKWIDSPLK
ncbi:hypothetical protein HNR50_003603 [Spirochaeta isovalerica]|uniref:Uncharacterized protein n=1 Tax=Spirochaeta isovalerica TaxID=150 RepID=A0A841RHZ0_9SPIO|nr:hypothetical protein [Spirochaeta isovalerica]